MGSVRVECSHLGDSTDAKEESEMDFELLFDDCNGVYSASEIAQNGSPLGIRGSPRGRTGRRWIEALESPGGGTPTGRLRVLECEEREEEEHASRVISKLIRKHAFDPRRQ